MMIFMTELTLSGLRLTIARMGAVILPQGIVLTLAMERHPLSDILLLPVALTHP
jgi:hypothetical protein